MNIAVHLNWGGGGAATAAAYLELRFGGALVSVANGADGPNMMRRVVPTPLNAMRFQLIGNFSPGILNLFWNSLPCRGGSIFLYRLTGNAS